MMVRWSGQGQNLKVVLKELGSGGVKTCYQAQVQQVQLVQLKSQRIVPLNLVCIQDDILDDIQDLEWDLFLSTGTDQVWPRTGSVGLVEYNKEGIFEFLGHL